ncbi:hypothetical protein HKD37_11G032249 [Glycine soja]
MHEASGSQLVDNNHNNTYGGTTSEDIQRAINKSLPPGFAKFLWESKFQTLSLINAEGLEEICHQRIHTKETKSIKTGRCWKKFCSKSRFKQGDTIKFEFGDKNENVAKGKATILYEDGSDGQNDVMGLLNWCWIREGAGNKRQKNLNECDIYRS